MKVIFLVIILFAIQNCIHAQEYINIKILKISEIEYYYVYKVQNNLSNQTITLISSKKDNEFEIIKLKENNCYRVKTRLRSAIKISDTGHILSKPTMMVINGVRISDSNELPILVLSYEHISNCVFEQ